MHAPARAAAAAAAATAPAAVARPAPTPCAPPQKSGEPNRTRYQAHIEHACNAGWARQRKDGSTVMLQLLAPGFAIVAEDED